MTSDSDQELEDRFHYSNRRRKVTRQWLREPDGEPLPRPPPVGTRAPNGLIWGHSCEDFMWIQRIPNVNVLTVWSRSMIKEFGENYDENEFDVPEPRPRVRCPWPVLRLPSNVLNREVPPVGAYDEDSDHENDGLLVRRWRVRVDNPKTGRAMKDRAVHRVVVENLEGVFMPNDGENPAISPLGHPYAALWKPAFRAQFAVAQLVELCGRFAIVRRSGSKKDRGELVDRTGLMAVIIEDYDEDNPQHNGLLIIEGECIEHVCHDPNPAIFLDTARRDNPDGEVTGKQPQESSTGDSSGSAGGARESASVAEDVDVPMSMATDTSGSESQSQGQGEPVTQDEESTTAESSRPHPAGAEALTGALEVLKRCLDDGKSRFVVLGPDSDEYKALEVLELESEGEDEVFEGDHDMEEVDATDEEEDPAEAPEGYIDDDGRFKGEIIADLPKLEEFIPEEHFPDALIVHRVSHEPQKYKRIYPKLERDDVEGEPERLGRLYLNGPKIGEGHHSYVRRAPLELPPPLSAYGKHRMVTVAAKTSFVHVSARKFLRHEAEIFSLFPRHLQEEYCGYNLVTPIKHPVPVGAVVPKFYGYYVPFEDDGSAPDRKYDDCVDDDTSPGRGASPILLMEECGDPIVPRKFSIDDRSECYSLVVRLHLAGFLQGSMYVRNILWQPGPLWKPPQERSRDTPSFRIIDFGRAMNWDEHVNKEKDEKKRDSKAKDWQDQAGHDRKQVERELLIKEWDY